MKIDEYSSVPITKKTGAPLFSLLCLILGNVMRAEVISVF